MALDLLWLAGGLAAGAMLVMLARKHWRNRRGAAFGSFLLLGIGHVFGGQEIKSVQESKNETRRKKDGQAGDPPEPQAD